MSVVSKKEMKESITAIKRDTIDVSGNKVVNVLSKANEFVIYEIDDPDMTNRLRVLIDGYTDESEKNLQDKFTRVKQKYIEAKGLLYNSQSQHTMKARVAHALSSVLHSDTDKYDGDFDKLIQQLKDEQSTMLTNKIAYATPASILTFLCFIIYMCSVTFPKYTIQISDSSINICILIFSTLIGSSLSIFYSLQKLKFNEIENSSHYYQVGVERIAISLVAAGAIFIAIKSGLIFSFLILNTAYKIAFIGILAGFSESFVPSILSKFNIDEKSE